jgi:hypothetical protein
MFAALTALATEKGAVPDSRQALWGCGLSWVGRRTDTVPAATTTRSTNAPSQGSFQEASPGVTGFCGFMIDRRVCRRHAWKPAAFG